MKSKIKQTVLLMLTALLPFGAMAVQLPVILCIKSPEIFDDINGPSGQKLTRLLDGYYWAYGAAYWTNNWKATEQMIVETGGTSPLTNPLLTMGWYGSDAFWIITEKLNLPQDSSGNWNWGELTDQLGGSIELKDNGVGTNPRWTIQVNNSEYFPENYRMAYGNFSSSVNGSPSPGPWYYRWYGWSYQDTSNNQDMTTVKITISSYCFVGTYLGEFASFEAPPLVFEFDVAPLHEAQYFHDIFYELPPE